MKQLYFNLDIHCCPLVVLTAKPFGLKKTINLAPENPVFVVVQWLGFSPLCNDIIFIYVPSRGCMFA